MAKGAWFEIKGFRPYGASQLWLGRPADHPNPAPLTDGAGQDKSAEAGKGKVKSAEDKSAEAGKGRVKSAEDTLPPGMASAVVNRRLSLAER